MRLKALFTDDDAVSPVIGVILMVAITVILAAVIGTFVLGLQDRVGAAAPNAAFSWDFNDGGDGWGNSNDWVNVTHDGGEQLNVDNINGTVGGETIIGVNSSVWASDVTAGDTLEISQGNFGAAGSTIKSSTAFVSDISQGDEVRIIWNNPEGDKTQTIAQNEIN